MGRLAGARDHASLVYAAFAHIQWHATPGGAGVSRTACRQRATATPRRCADWLMPFRRARLIRDRVPCAHRARPPRIACRPGYRHGEIPHGRTRRVALRRVGDQTDGRPTGASLAYTRTASRGARPGAVAHG